MDSVSLNSFLAAYQTVAPLKLGELWAVPIMLRLALIENLRRVATRVAGSRRDRDLAADWAERMVQVVEQNPTDLILVMADMARANPPLSGAFLAEMTRHLQGQSPHFAFANSWLAQRLVGARTDDRTARAGGRTGTGRRSGLDGQQHHQPPVSQLQRLARLRRETQPGGADSARRSSVYADMDFATRDRYRHVVEEIAKQSPFSEHDVARKAIQLAKQESGGRNPAAGNERTSHVGYYLIDRGRSVLEKNAVTRLPPWTRAARMVGRIPLFAYLFGVLLITAIVDVGLSGLVDLVGC